MTKIQLILFKSNLNLYIMKCFKKNSKEELFKNLTLEKQSYIKYLNNFIQTLNLKIIILQKKLDILKNKLKNEDLTICSICMEEQIDCAFIPCGHTFCSKCIFKNSTNSNLRCFMCRNEVFQYLKIYL